MREKKETGMFARRKHLWTTPLRDAAAMSCFFPTCYLFVDTTFCTVRPLVVS